jgi:alpha-glucosidase
VDVQEADRSSLLHAFRRFLHWRRGVPALVHGTLRPVALPSPLVGFVREHDGQRVLAVFNLSDRAVVLDLAGFQLGVTMEGHGFEGCLGNDGRLQPFGVLFAELATVGVSVPMTSA